MTLLKLNIVHIDVNIPILNLIVLLNIEGYNTNLAPAMEKNSIISAQDNVMPQQELSYKGCKILIKTEDDEIQLKINNEEIEVQLNKSDQTYLAPQLSFKKFSTVTDLAKDIIDNVILRRRQ